jgi:hypothetical protein
MLDAIARQHPGVLVEDKGASIAVHYRKAPQLEGALRWMLEQLVRDLGGEFDLQPGACVLELKLRGPNKADAIQAFLAEPPFAGRIPLFAGDDLTDIDGFEAVERAGGLSISVGDRVRGRLRFASPAQLRAFLAELLPRYRPQPGAKHEPGARCDRKLRDRRAGGRIGSHRLGLPAEARRRSGVLFSAVARGRRRLPAVCSPSNCSTARAASSATFATRRSSKRCSTTARATSCA